MCCTVVVYSEETFNRHKSRCWCTYLIPWPFSSLFVKHKPGSVKFHISWIFVLLLPITSQVWPYHLTTVSVLHIRTIESPAQIPSSQEFNYYIHLQLKVWQIFSPLQLQSKYISVIHCCQIPYQCPDTPWPKDERGRVSLVYISLVPNSFLPIFSKKISTTFWLCLTNSKIYGCFQKEIKNILLILMCTHQWSLHLLAEHTHF